MYFTFINLSDSFHLSITSKIEESSTVFVSSYNLRKSRNLTCRRDLGRIGGIGECADWLAELGFRIHVLQMDPKGAS